MYVNELIYINFVYPQKYPIFNFFLKKLGRSLPQCSSAHDEYRFRLVVLVLGQALIKGWGAEAPFLSRGEMQIRGFLTPAPRPTTRREIEWKREKEREREREGGQPGGRRCHASGRLLSSLHDNRDGPGKPKIRKREREVDQTESPARLRWLLRSTVRRLWWAWVWWPPRVTQIKGLRV